MKIDSELNTVSKPKDLDLRVFSLEEKRFGESILEASYDDNSLYLYTVCSGFNGAEIGEVRSGFNGFVKPISERRKSATQHGYLTTTGMQADELILAIKKNYNDIEYLVVGNKPEGGGDNRVYQILVTTPAFGRKDHKGADSSTPDQKKELAYLLALMQFRASFEMAIELKEDNPGKKVIFRAAAAGLSVFGKDRSAVLKGFYEAAKEYEQKLLQNGIEVRLQDYQGREGFSSDLGLQIK